VGACAIFAIAYIALASTLQTATWLWSAILATFASVTIGTGLVRSLKAMAQDDKQVTAAVKQVGELVVNGEREEVEQYAIANYATIGARVIEAVRSQSDDTLRIHGATGSRILSSLFLGEYVTVEVANRSGQCRVRVESTKLDFLTPTRSRRNVADYLQGWITFPSGRGSIQALTGNNHSVSPQPAGTGGVPDGVIPCGFTCISGRPQQ
jgi:hypothetical protein